MTALQGNSMKQFALVCPNVSGDQNWKNLFPFTQSAIKMDFVTRLENTEM